MTTHRALLSSTRRLTLGVLAATGLSAALLAPAAHAQNALDNILKAKEIKIAIPTDYPPYGFVGTDLKPQGLDVEMAQYIGTKLGVKVGSVITGVAKHSIADVTEFQRLINDTPPEQCSLDLEGGGAAASAQVASTGQ